jgi:hypothetical protein
MLDIDQQPLSYFLASQVATGEGLIDCGPTQARNEGKPVNRGEFHQFDVQCHHYSSVYVPLTAANDGN